MADRLQFAALPYILVGKRIEICLITSRDTGRWITPKGWPEERLSPRELAAREAYEEAGLKGRVARRAAGRYSYAKRLDDGTTVDCLVTVFPLWVEQQVVDWPEKAERRLAWVKRKKAAKLVDDAGLAEIIRRFKVLTPAG